jgi:hypothetical protein
MTVSPLRVAPHHLYAHRNTAKVNGVTLHANYLLDINGGGRVEESSAARLDIRTWKPRSIAPDRFEPCAGTPNSATITFKPLR